MRSRLALGPLLALALAIPAGAASSSPESVVRAWSKALNAGDNTAAGSLFAPGARVIQGGLVLVLRTRAQAVRWNSGLPCSGRIVSISTGGDTVRATFVLGRRPGIRCNGTGARAAAVIRVRDGKIVLWQQVPVGQADQPPGQAV